MKKTHDYILYFNRAAKGYGEFLPYDAHGAAALALDVSTVSLIVAYRPIRIVHEE